MTIPYDAGALSGWRGLWRLFVRWRGTILSATIRGPLFWLSNVLHVGLLILNGKLALGQWTAATNATTGETYFEFTPFFTTYELWQVGRARHRTRTPSNSLDRRHARSSARRRRSCRGARR